MVELLVVLAIIALLLTLAVPRYFQSVAASKEAVLKENLRTTRESIDRFYGDRGRYPENLEELVEKRYLRSVPVDPVTESAASWTMVPPDDGVIGRVFDLRSGAPGVGRNGKPYSEW